MYFVVKIEIKYSFRKLCWKLGLRCLIRICSLDIEGVFLIFRFDLIFLILDPQDDVYDRRLANHLVSLYFHGKEQQEEEHLVGVTILLTLRKNLKLAPKVGIT